MSLHDLRPTLAQMSGEDNYKRAPVMPLNEVRLNGQTGKYIYTNILSGRKAIVDGKEEYEKHDLGVSVHLVFLKIRRKLSYFQRDSSNMMVTNEHNVADDYVSLFGAMDVEKGLAKQLRFLHPELRTQQIVYCMLPDSGEIVRLTVKGSSLGSDAKPEERLSFYEYIQSFDHRGIQGTEEHFYEFITQLGVGEETGKLGPYKTVDFVRGRKLTPEEMQKVEQAMTSVFAFCKATDEYYANPNNKLISSPDEMNEQVVAAEDDEIAPKDIPF